MRVREGGKVVKISVVLITSDGHGGIKATIAEVYPDKVWAQARDVVAVAG